MIATIGVFDGVHRGHRALCELVIDRARARGVEAMVITFEPHPISVLAPDLVSHRLTSLPIKLRLLTELGLDWVWTLPFSRTLAALSPRDFLEKLLLRQVSLQELWVGYDFRFGRGREGEITFLRQEGQRLGFEVQQFGPVHEGGRVLSSTWVREALNRGAIEEAAGVLGHAFVLEGMVRSGRGQGAKVLVPTANLEFPPEQILPAYGVYAAWAETLDQWVPSVVNVGVRPTLTDATQVVVEAHLIDWTGELRGVPLALHFVSRIRPEKKFSGLSALKDAVAEDIGEARSRLR